MPDVTVYDSPGGGFTCHNSNAPILNIWTDDGPRIFENDVTYVFQNNQWRRLMNIKQDNSFEREYHLAYMGGSPTITEPLVKNSLSEQMEDVPE